MFVIIKDTNVPQCFGSLIDTKKNQQLIKSLLDTKNSGET